MFALLALGVVGLGPAGAQVQLPARGRTDPIPPAASAPGMGAATAAATPGLPVFRIGALLPLTGPSAWYGEQMKRGLDLALADQNPPPPRRGRSLAVAPRGDDARAGTGTRSGAEPARPGREDDQTAESAEEPRDATPTSPDGSRRAPSRPERLPATETARSGDEKPATGNAARAGGPAPDGARHGRDGPSKAAPPGPPRTVRFALEVVDVQPLNVKAAAEALARVVASGATVVFTASATPTLAVLPVAGPQGVLVVHQGRPEALMDAERRLVLHTRAPVARRAETLVAYAWERGARRLGLLAAGDEAGKAVRATVAARWRERGGALLVEESLSLDFPDLDARLSRAARARPEAMVLGFQGPDLGDVARRLRQAGYDGVLLALEDDPAVFLAAGPDVTDWLLLSDAFHPVPGTRGERFAQAYEAKYSQPPSRFAANAYEAVSMLAEAVRAVLRERGALPGGARLREQLAAQPAYPSLRDGPVVVRDDGVLDRPLALLAVHRGRAAFVRHVMPTGRPAFEPPEPPGRTEADAPMPWTPG